MCGGLGVHTGQHQLQKRLLPLETSLGCGHSTGDEQKYIKNKQLNLIILCPLAMVQVFQHTVSWKQMNTVTQMCNCTLFFSKGAAIILSRKTNYILFLTGPI